MKPNYLKMAITFLNKTLGRIDWHKEDREVKSLIRLFKKAEKYGRTQCK